MSIQCCLCHRAVRTCVLCVALFCAAVMSWEADSSLPILATFAPLGDGEDKVSSSFVPPSQHDSTMAFIDFDPCSE